MYCSCFLHRLRKEIIWGINFFRCAARCCATCISRYGTIMATHVLSAKSNGELSLLISVRGRLALALFPSVLSSSPALGLLPFVSLDVDVVDMARFFSRSLASSARFFATFGSFASLAVGKCHCVTFEFLWW